MSAPEPAWTSATSGDLSAVAPRPPAVGMKASIVIPTHNGRQRLLKTLESLGCQTVRAPVIVFVNGSTDGTAAAVGISFPGVRVIMNERNLGFGRAVNRAAEEAEGQMLVLINDDVVCAPDFMERLIAPFQDPRVGMVAGVLLQSGAPERIDSAGIELDATMRAHDLLWNQPVGALKSGPYRPVGPCGGAAAYRLEAFREAGGFDERLFAYWEDTDLAIRLREAGWQGVLAPEARALHEHGATLGAVPLLQWRLDAFGRAYVLAKHRVLEGHPLLRLATALLDYPTLLSYLLLRGHPEPLVARFRGFSAGRRERLDRTAPLHLRSVSFLEAVRRQLRFYKLRLSGRLPSHLAR